MTCNANSRSVALVLGCAALAILAPAGTLRADDASFAAEDLRGEGGEWLLVQREAGGGREARDSAEVANTLDRFHRALASGDSATALSLLTPDAVILEAGGIETKEEYRSHHLGSDIAFAAAVPRERSPLRVVVQGDVAWASSTSTMRGEFGGRQINSAAAELAVLTRTPEGWRISAIHWSSRTLRQ